MVCDTRKIQFNLKTVYIVQLFYNLHYFPLIYCKNWWNNFSLNFSIAEIKGSANYPTLNEMLPPTADAIKALAHCHSQLCDIIECVNQVYQIQNLLGIIVCTLKMLPHLFLTGIILTYSNFKILHSSFFLWPAQYLYRVFIVCNSATKVTTEVSIIV